VPADEFHFDGVRVGACRPPLRAADIDLLREDLEFLGVVGQQRHTVNIGGRGDRKVERPPPRLAAALGDECV
jgi:hypothetical protein